MRKRWKRALLASWAGGASVMAYTNKVIALSPIAYWPLAESSGTTATDESGNGRNGTYSNVTLGVTGIGDGRTAAQFVPASNSFCNIYSASFAGAFNGSEGTVSAWAQVSAAGVWTDGQARRVFRFATGTAGNRIEGFRNGVNNQFEIDYLGSNVAKGAVITTTTTAWFQFAISWSASNDQVKIYFNGAQQGATLTGLGAWAGIMSATQNVLGANITTPASLWSGNIAHVAVWASILTPTQIAALAVVP